MLCPTTYYRMIPHKVSMYTLRGPYLSIHIGSPNGLMRGVLLLVPIGGLNVYIERSVPLDAHWRSQSVQWGVYSSQYTLEVPMYTLRGFSLSL